ncbi:MAG: twin transmembrane helix small protein [Burkholderiaceae bacterium]|uniref:twin transmembrane helix small protein n=1 Tax=Ottowia sp. TaxID=1898956 RepID=UPI001D963FFC|nr:twin transmembrane helix small protein [Ottowia sp.]MCB2023178.1 twin transmembrane helix small protein [Ottowia sp.]MCP5257121.1 twin transmembrane helix small protein [Burkholderiaceae bacterium]HRW71531.1 twin transmembrane helix small protein [Ottowia sp.]
MKWLVALAFIGIVVSLASALFFMLNGGRGDPGDETARSGRMVRALAMRVGLSVALFLCILLAWKLGYIHPTGIGAGQ